MSIKGIAQAGWSQKIKAKVINLSLTSPVVFLFVLHNSLIWEMEL